VVGINREANIMTRAHLKKDSDSETGRMWFDHPITVFLERREKNNCDERGLMDEGLVRVSRKDED
jgi:hypothetical protein